MPDGHDAPHCLQGCGSWRLQPIQEGLMLSHWRKMRNTLQDFTERLCRRGEQSDRGQSNAKGPTVNLGTPLSSSRYPPPKHARRNHCPPRKATWKYSFWISTNQLAPVLPSSGLLTSMKMVRDQPSWGHNSYKMPEVNEEGGLLQHSLQLSPQAEWRGDGRSTLSR